MKIRNMTARFGGLRDERLELGEGLNIITAPNEGGKSTWCGFIKAMLYGVDSAQRAKAGVLPDKKRFAPWDGSPMAGEMELCWGEREITLSRGGKAGTPMRNFSAVYTGTGTPVPELTGPGAGELLTGVSRPVFESSAFVGQGALRVRQGPELEKRIAAMVSSGEEEVSFSETEKRLAAWQRRRRWRSSGELPELEAELEKKTAAREALEASGGETAQLEAEVKRREVACEALRAQVTESRKQVRKNALARSGAARETLHQSQQAAAEAKAREESLARQLRESRFGGRTPEAVTQELAEAAAREKTLASQGRKKPSRGSAALVLLLGLLLIAGALGLTAAGRVSLPLGIAAAALGVAAGVFGLLGLRRVSSARKRAEAAAAERRELLAHYGVDSGDALLPLGGEYRALYGAWQEAVAARECAETALEAATAAQTQTEASVLSALDFSGGDSQAAELGRALRREEEQLQRSREALAAAKGRMELRGDPLSLGSELEALSARRQLLQGEYEAISLALELLREADEEMQTRYSPRLSARAAELFSRLTGGRYDRLTLDKALSPEARRRGDTLGHEALYLSAGAYDQLYLALRLAICQLALEGSDCPLVLDDVFCSFDDERCREALELLRSLAKERQILLFTCHSREAEMLSGAEDVRVIRL